MLEAGALTTGIVVFGLTLGVLFVSVILISVLIGVGVRITKIIMGGN